MLGPEIEFVIGVDTHMSNHTAAVVTSSGGLVASREISVNAAGYKELLEFTKECAAGPRLWAVEGTRSYGLGLSRYLEAAGETVVEIDGPRRPARKHGKSDEIDAVRAAREALTREHLATPRQLGAREALRILVVARDQTVLSRTRASRCLWHLALGLPDAVRERVVDRSSHSWERLTKRCMELKADRGTSFEDRVRLETVARLARQVSQLEKEALTYEREIRRLVLSMAPALLGQRGVGPLTAAQILLAWSHRGRLRNEAAFAALAGVAPLPASSGQVVRHRLSRQGDRQLNSALHTVVLNRARYDAETQAYINRRRQEGKSDRDIRRCLKRHLARRLFKLLEASPPQAAFAA